MIKRTWPTEREIDAAAACIHEKPQECQLVDFVTQDGRCHSFPLAQLVLCVLEKNPASEEQSDAPSDRLTIMFPTQDVVIVGWNLKQLRDALDRGKLVLVRARDARHLGVEDGQAFVSGISITDGAHK
jgi:hypothetical protein